MGVDQGAVTPIDAVVSAATGVTMGSQGHGGFAGRSRGHGGFCGWSQGHGGRPVTMIIIIIIFCCPSPTHKIKRARNGGDMEPRLYYFHIIIIILYYMIISLVPRPFCGGGKNGLVYTVDACALTSVKCP